jgi:hypothetical protein
MKAISIKQPWAQLIVEGIKDIENRTWACPKKNIGKRVLIHAALDKHFEKNARYGELNTVNEDQFKCIMQHDKELEIFGTHLQYGAIIGSVEIVGSVINHSSIWAKKTDGVFDINIKKFIPRSKPKPIYNWILANPIKFPVPISAKGKLRFWEFSEISDPADIFKRVTTEDLNALKTNTYKPKL